MLIMRARARSPFVKVSTNPLTCASDVRHRAGWYSYLDHTGGFYGAIAALMALWRRSQTGEGQHIDMSQVETGMVLAGLPMIDSQVNGRSYEAIGNRSRWPAVAPHGIYRCAGDDRWIAIAAEDDAQWAALCEVLGLDAADARFATPDASLDAQAELDAAIEVVTRGGSAEELAAQLVERGVPAGVCQTAEDRLEHDPQLADRGFYPRADHPSLGEHRFEGLPMYFDGERPGVRAAGPDLGGDRESVLRDLLGFTDDEIARMLAEAAI